MRERALFKIVASCCAMRPAKFPGKDFVGCQADQFILVAKARPLGEHLVRGHVATSGILDEDDHVGHPVEQGVGQGSPTEARKEKIKRSHEGASDLPILQFALGFLPRRDALVLRPCLRSTDR